MRRALASLPLALLFIANVVPSFAQSAVPAPAEPAEVEVVVREGAPLELACALRVEQRAAWRREGGALPADLAPAAGEEPGRPAGALTVRLRAPAARAQHAGLYQCAPGPRAQRLRVVVEPAPAPAPATGASAPPPPPPPGSEAAAAAAAQPAAPGPLYYEVNRNASITCTLDNPSKLPIVWKKNDTVLEQVPELAGRYRLEADGARLVIPPRAHEADAGNYSCHAGDAAQPWRLHGRAYTKLPPNTSVVEGQKLKLVCRVVGRPAPAVEWRYNNGSLPEGAVLGTSDAGVEGATLELAAAARDHAGDYSCHPLAPAEARSVQPDAATTVRVKDMYAALWPFLGICAEVLVLCVVILCYERRRAKPELDDSDTDNHDQKKS